MLSRPSSKYAHQRGRTENKRLLSPRQILLQSSTYRLASQRVPILLAHLERTTLEPKHQACLYAKRVSLGGNVDNKILELRIGVCAEVSRARCNGYDKCRIGC